MDVESRIKALQACRLFESVPRSDLATLAETMHEEYFGHGEFVCRQGERADRVFVVITGNLEVRVAGWPEPASRVQSGELFGEYGLFAEGFRTASVVSADESVLLTLDYPRFRAFLLMFPETTLAILEATVRRLHTVQQRAAREGEA
jgi:CRP-like cAMP-binding protein